MIVWGLLRLGLVAVERNANEHIDLIHPHIHKQTDKTNDTIFTELDSDH